MLSNTGCKCNFFQIRPYLDIHSLNLKSIGGGLSAFGMNFYQGASNLLKKDMLQNEQGKWIWYTNFISKGFLSVENALNTKRKLLYQFDVVFCHTLPKFKSLCRRRKNRRGFRASTSH